MDTGYKKVTTQTIKDKKGIVQSIKNLFESQPYQALVKTCSDMQDKKKMNSYKDLQTGIEALEENSYAYMCYTVNRLGGCKDKNKMLTEPEDKVEEAFKKKYPNTKPGLGKLWAEGKNLTYKTSSAANRDTIEANLVTLLTWLKNDGGINWYPTSEVLKTVAAMLARMDTLDLEKQVNSLPTTVTDDTKKKIKDVIGNMYAKLCNDYGKKIKKGTDKLPETNTRNGIIEERLKNVNKKLTKTGFKVTYKNKVWDIEQPSTTTSA